MSKHNRRLGSLVLGVVLGALGLALTPALATAQDDDMKVGLPKGWFGGPFGGGAYDIGIDVKTFKSGKAAAFIRCTAPGNGAVLTQMVAPGDLAGKRVRYSGQVKTAGAEPGVGLWMRVDAPKGMASFDNMGTRMVKGDTEWSKAEIVLDVPADATGLAFGVILYGKGTVRIDDLALEAVGQDVKVTAPLNPNPAGMGRPDSSDLPDKPTNLGFEDGIDEGFSVATRPLTDAEKAWLNKALIPLASVEPRAGFADLQPLKKVIGDARIVSLGESTHGTREHFLMKHRLLEFLATEVGFTHFAIEANMTEAFAVNDYVLTGKGEAKKALAGLYFWTWYTEEVLAMIEWMRDYNKTAKTKLQFLGFDMQTGQVALEQTRAFVAKVDPAFAREAEEKFKLAAPLFPKSPEDYAKVQSMKKEDKQPAVDAIWAVVKHLEQNRDQYEKALPGEADRGIQNARVAAQAAKVGIVNTYNYRDECMATNTTWILDHAPKGSKIVLWAHNGHVARVPGAMGDHLAKKHGRDQIVVGFATSEGEYTAIATGKGLKKDNPLKSPPRESLESILRETGKPNFILDLRPSASEANAKWLTRPHLFRSIGALAMESQFYPVIAPQQYDVLVYVDKTTASRCFGFTQGR